MNKNGLSKLLLDKYSRLIILFLIVTTLSLLRPGSFFTWQNISTVMFQQVPFTILMSFGMTFAIITRGIDKSMGSVLVISSIVAADAIKSDALLLGIAIALSIGVFCGVINGLLITKMGIHPFIATYGVDFVAIGVAYVYTGGVSVYGFPDSFRDLCRGVVPWANYAAITTLIFVLLHVVMVGTPLGKRLFPARGESVSEEEGVPGVKKPVNLVMSSIVNGILAVVLGMSVMQVMEPVLPNLAVITFFIFIILHILTAKTNFGRRMYSAGFNEEATALSGNNVHNTIIIVYIINGLLAASAGLLYMARLNAADPNISGNFTLDSIAAALVGGSSFGGGKGTVGNAVVGALIIVFIRNGMNIMGVHATWQQTAIGFIILFSILLEAATRRILARLDK